MIDDEKVLDQVQRLMRQLRSPLTTDERKAAKVDNAEGQDKKRDQVGVQVRDITEAR